MRESSTILFHSRGSPATFFPSPREPTTLASIPAGFPRILLDSLDPIPVQVSKLNVTDCCLPCGATEQLLADLAAACNTNLLPGNEQFRRGDRVVVLADPEHFRQLQTKRYGGWNDDMALVLCHCHHLLRLSDLVKA